MRVRLIMRSGILLSALALGVGCGADMTGSAPLSLDRQYTTLALNHHAITLGDAAPYNTIQLIATPLTADGTPLTDTAALPTYTVNDPALTVSATGVLTATAPVFGAVVTVALKIGHLTLRDTAVVNANPLNAPPPVLTVFSLQPLPGDSIKTDLLNPVQLHLTITDAHGDSIPSAVVLFRSADTLAATVDQLGVVQGLQPGKVMLYAEATVYGVKKKDSLLFTVTQPSIATVQVLGRLSGGHTVSYFSPETLSVVRNGIVLWYNSSGQTTDVTFDTPSAVAVPDDKAEILNIVFAIPFDALQHDGNITTLIPQDTTRGNDGIGAAGRMFPSLGLHPYHSTRYGTVGFIKVVTE